MTKKKTLIFIPTYNESENIEEIYNKLIEQGLGADILFLDDNSPDGTGMIIDKLAENNSNTYVIHRSGKLGIGSAHIDGINWAYNHHYEVLITMDCDFTHSPSYIIDFITNSTNHDIVVGSRYLQNDSLASWNLFRKSLTHLGHILTTVLLGMPYDASGAFRLYRLDKINKEIFNLVVSKRYSFFFEMLFILHINKYSIKEIPIYLPARTYGHSKMTIKDAWHSFTYLITISTRSLFNKKSLIYSEKIKPDILNKEKKTQQDWELYWSEKKDSSNIIFDIIAKFYRKFVLKNILNHFIKKYYTQGQELLHAGCGGGQVDTDIAKYIHITALDISTAALDIYKSMHKNECKIVQGNIFNLPFENETFEGIYNLGVMEHFTEEEIHQILLEFKRVLKPNAIMVILWPPAFGLTVMALDFIHFVLNKILKRNIKLHPDEITRIKSKAHVKNIFEKAGFALQEYYFGIRDFFTQTVIVVQNKRINLKNNNNESVLKFEFPCPICKTNDIDVICPDNIGNESVTFNYDFSKKHSLTYRIVKCKNCTHCYASPRPKDIYVNYIDVIDETYLVNEAQYLATFQKALKKINNYIPSGRLLDVGCSTGIFLTVAKEFYQVEGLELSNWATSIARRKGLTIHKCKLGEMNMNPIYDIVTMWGVIEHFEYPDEEIKNISKLLRDGGIICLWTGDISSWPAKLLGKKWWYYQGQHIQMFSRKSIIKLFNNNGFKLLNMSNYSYIMTMKSINKSLARYPLIYHLTKPILTSKFLSNKMLTVKVPGEMFAIFKKD